MLHIRRDWSPFVPARRRCITREILKALCLCGVVRLLDAAAFGRLLPLMVESWIQYSSHKGHQCAILRTTPVAGQMFKKCRSTDKQAATLEMKILDSTDWKE